MNFCHNGSSIFTVWTNHGLQHCFLDTVGAIVVSAIMVVFGSAELRMYWKYSTLLDSVYLHNSKMFKMQMTFVVILMFVPLVSLSLTSTVLGRAIVGYEILWSIVTSFTWLYALLLMYIERNYDLPMIPPRGHGIILLIYVSIMFIIQNLSFISFNSPHWYFQQMKLTDRPELAIFVLTYICTLFVFIFTIYAPGIATMARRGGLRERQSVAPAPATNATGTGTHRSTTFRNILPKLKLMLPVIWPKGQYGLQIRVLSCFLILILARVVNVYVPIMFKLIVNSLTDASQSFTAVPYVTFPWKLILIYVALRTVQGSGSSAGGLFNILRSFLWIRVQQYTSREIQVKLYTHLHSLSLRWHLGRKTGEVLRVMDRGTNSIQQLLSYLLFQIVPTIIDIIVAIVYFATAFNLWFGLIVTLTMVLYLVCTVIVTEWRTKFRREMNKLDNETQSKGVDSLLNFETVKYYNGEDYEIDRYQSAVVAYQGAEWLSMATMSLLNFIQNGIINVGFLAGALLCAYFISERKDNFNVGDYVLFSTYIMQLYGPLNWLGSYYRMIQQSFIDMENMFELLDEPSEVEDVPNAPDLVIHRGSIEFRDVYFAYAPERPILKGVSFRVAPGGTVALVGPSGSGKSTIIRLLFRFFDIQSGEILFDDTDISAVAQKSLRSKIGVVPQDTVLFNNTIMYNIRYGRVNASDVEVEKAAQAAEIHERILNFPASYDTMVGERGLKLSGGEKQRVAIARTILKAPHFILLDEATSALDTKTERAIQASLNLICVGKTTVIVAHRLSTIIHADEILVLKEGEIVERGRHEELLKMDSIYADMWNEQLQKAEDTSTLDDSIDLGVVKRGKKEE